MFDYEGCGGVGFALAALAVGFFAVIIFLLNSTSAAR